MKRYDDFTKWNDEMIKKFDLEHYHDNANFIIRFIENRRIKYILKFLQPNEGEEIIEIGCGAGDILGRIKKGNLTGLDVSQYILEIAKKRYQGIKFIVGNAEELPEDIRKNQYDKVFCSEVLEHVENPQKALREMKGIAKDIVVVSIPNEKLINRIKGILQKLRIFGSFFPKLSRKMDDEWHLTAFDLNKLKEIAGDDYSIENAQGIPYNWLPLRYVVKLKIKVWPR